MIRLTLFFALIAITSATIAQSPDPSLWSGSTNPNGEPLVPVVAYEQDTGIVWVNTLGWNQTLDSTSRTEIGGDDIGMISLSFASSIDHTEVLLRGFIDGVVWNSSFARNQVFGVGAGANFLRPTERINVFRFPSGMTANDFSQIELAVNFASGFPGSILVGEMQFNDGILDVNDDGNFDCADANELASEIASQNNDLQFDFDGDSIVGQSDFDLWLERFAQLESNQQLPYLRGDINFDGGVDVLDFNVWNANKFTHSTAYCDGNFNLDDRIDVSDFNIWLSNRFRSSNTPVSVPEPASYSLLLMAILLLRRPRC
jgi:hypothetical protein